MLPGSWRRSTALRRLGQHREYPPRMPIEVRIFDGQHGIFHHLGDFFDRQKATALLTKLTQQDAILGIHAQRQLRTVIGQAGGVGQSRLGQPVPEPMPKRKRLQQHRAPPAWPMPIAAIPNEQVVRRKDPQSLRAAGLKACRGNRGREPPIIERHRLSASAPRVADPHPLQRDRHLRVPNLA